MQWFSIKQIITAIYLLLFNNTSSLTMPKRVHKSFLKHDQSNMINIFENMFKYIDSKTNVSNHNNEEMLITYKSIYKDACVYLLHNKSNSVYLGWIPLKNQTLLSKYYKNITKKIDIQTNIRNIPLYYLVCEPIPQNNTFQVKKILCNPTIDLDIELLLLKNDLLDFSDKYDIILDLSPLITYDSGRWFLEFNYLFKF